MGFKFGIQSDILTENRFKKKNKEKRRKKTNMEHRSKEINRNGNIPAKLDNHLCSNELAPGANGHEVELLLFPLSEEFSQPNDKSF